MRATGLHRGWECKWQPGNSPNRFMEESLWAVIKTSTRFKLSSANKICNCKTTVLQWNFPLQDVKERRKHCCTQGGDAHPDCRPSALNSPSLTPVAKTSPCFMWWLASFPEGLQNALPLSGVWREAPALTRKKEYGQNASKFVSIFNFLDYCTLSKVFCFFIPCSSSSAELWSCFVNKFNKNSQWQAYKIYDFCHL